MSVTIGMRDNMTNTGDIRRRSAAGTEDTESPGSGARLRGLVTAIILILAATAGCASGGVSFTDTTFQGAEVRDLEEQFSTAFEFLRAHGRVNFAPLGRQGDEVMLVYERGRSSISSPGTREGALIVDNRRVPDPIPYLRELRMSQVESIRILRASEASARHGGDGRTGAVSITTRGS